MKKKIFTLLGLAMAGAASVNAQFALQNFNAAGLPTGWTLINDANTISPTISPAYIIPLLQANAWTKFQSASGDSAMISTSYFNPAATADRWLVTPAFTVNNTNMILTWSDKDMSGAASPIEVWISTTGGGNAAAFSTRLATSTSGAEWAKKGVYLGGYNGQSVRIGFRNHAQSAGFPGIDNVQSEVPSTALDAALVSLSFPTLMTSGTAPVVTVKNNGAQAITALTVTYKIDGGTAVSQNFTGLNLQPYFTQDLTFSTPVSGLSAASHTIQVDITQTNGAADPVTSNNSANKAFAVPSQAVTRAGLIEEFTSSTCVPCANFNVTFDPLILSNNANIPSSNFNIIKYQMNWPSPGNDVSYNPDGLTRRNYYGVSGIPDHYTNGAAGANGNQAEIDASKTAPAYITMNGSYIVKGDSIIATLTMTPNFTITGANWKLYMAATERHYTNNGATTTQKEYYHVMRKMLPNGNGIAVANWTAGQTQTFRQAYKYTTGSVAQGNYNFWATPFNGTLVAFVQDDASGEVFQSKAIPATWPAAVATVAAVGEVKLFPNPATSQATVSFNVKEKSNVSAQVIDLTGRIVATLADEEMSAGAHQLTINTSAFASGVYNVVLRTEGGSVTERLNVVK